QEHETVRLEKEDGRWTLVEPVRARTSQSNVDRLVNALDRARVEDSFTDVAPADYGLEKPPVRVTVEAEGGETERLKIGNRSTDGQKVYVQRGDDRAVHVVPVSLYNDLTQSPDDLRDKRLIPATVTDASSLTLETGDGAFRLAKRGSGSSARW